MKKHFLFLSILFLALGCSNGILGVVKTTDGGGTWLASNQIQNSTNSIANLTVTNLAFDPTNRQTIFLSSIDNGLWKSDDSGQSWHQILSKITIYDFWINPQDNNTIIAAGIFSNHGKIVRSRDGGKSWEQIYNEASNTNPVDTIVANPGNGQELYAALLSGVLIKSIDGGTDWFVQNDFKEEILQLRFRGAALYALTPKNVRKSTDYGQNFIDITTALAQASPGTMHQMALDNSSQAIYVTAENGLFKSDNDGSSWILLNLPVKKTANKPNAIATTRGGMIAYTSIASTIFKTLDGGKSWQTQTLPTQNNVNSILIDPTLPQISYAGLQP